ncbi:hypothetical protein [Spirulina major]|uniref:hypothetical protein n=1 Tax=Spirulina major TaxID=270636 RepID=UPI00093531D6|nr:hypothetical protein [Spirulina major]
MNNEKDTLRPEYSEDLIRSGQRGKYIHRYQAGTNIVMIEPDRHRIFPNAEAVNHALREYAKENQLS